MTTNTADTLAPSEIIDPDFYQEHGYPHEAWTELRRSNPVARCEAPGFLPFWAITRQAEIIPISKDPATFQSAPMLAMFHEEGGDTSGSNLRHLLNMDNPDHRAYRKIISARFTPRVVKPRLKDYQDLADDVLDRVIGKEEIDFVTEVSALLPIWIIADMLGVPAQDRERLFHWTNMLIGAGDAEFRNEGADVEATVASAIQEMSQYFHAMVEERRRNPTEDLTSSIANAQVDGAPIPPFELFSYLILVVVAGNETTRNAISGGLRAFIENPGEWAKLQARPELLDSAIEEIVRWVTPVIQFCRTPNRDVEINGKSISAGEHLCLFYPSANRDEGVFEDPFAFRVDRQPNPHLAFGIGEHVCLGANIARLEIKGLYSRLLERMISAEAAGPVERLRSSFVGGIKHMPIRWELRGRT